MVPADFLDQIDFAQEIDAERRRHDVPPVGCRRDRQPEAAQDPLDVVDPGPTMPSNEREPLASKVQRPRAARRGITIDDGARDAGRRRSVPSARPHAEGPGPAR